MQSLSRGVIAILQRGSLGPVRSLAPGVAAALQDVVKEPASDLHSRWARGFGASCSYSSRGPSERSDGGRGRILTQLDTDDMEALEVEQEQLYDEGPAAESPDEAGPPPEGDQQRPPAADQQAPPTVAVPFPDRKPAASHDAGSTLARWLPDAVRVESRRDRMQALDKMREPDDKEEDLMDPLELKIWLKEHFMKQDLPLSNSLKELIFRNYWDKVLVDVRRTVKVTKSAKLDTYHAVACVGNYEGLFGVGIASSSNAQVVVGEAYMKAYQNLVPIPLYRGHTIYHKIEHKFHTIKMILMPRPAGYGLVCNPMLRQLCVMIGIKDICVKVMGRRNRRNKFEVVKCFLEALQQQSTPHDGIEGTGVYAREVFYGRQRGKRLPCGLLDGKASMLVDHNDGRLRRYRVPHGGLAGHH